jgi:hypothetical protein
MPKPHPPKQSPIESFATDLLTFYDDLTELNACTAFVLRSCAAAMAGEGGMAARSAEGAVFCSQRLIDRAVELELRLKKIGERERRVTRKRRAG